MLAAYYGLRGKAALGDFKERFLLVNAEENLQTNLSLGNIARGLQGGVNDTTGFPVWLDNHLYNHATLKDLLARPRPRVWINASDVYNRTAFIFAPVTFSALCSDLTNYPVSLAVAASAAVPVVFAPIVIQNYTGACPVGLPEWVRRVQADPAALAADQALCQCARALSLGRSQIRKTPRRRAGRQLRPVRFHHREACFQHARTDRWRRRKR